MEKKDRKMGKKILIIILIFVALFIILTARKMIIIRNLQSNVKKYINVDNYYARVYEYQGSSLNINETYKKGEISLSTFKHLNEEKSKSKLINYKKGELSNLYIDTLNEKIVMINSNGVPGEIEILDYLYTENIWQFLVRSIKSSIKAEEINGKECYKINVSCFDILCFDNHRLDTYYLEKNTGLLIRKENGTSGYDDDKINLVSDYYYKFDIVKDEDIKEPDISEYKIQEN